METQLKNLPRHKLNRDVYASFPQNPGIYIYWQGQTAIYIGKSVNLKSRLLSYLAAQLGPKTRQMMNEADSVSYLIVTTDLESLLLEAKLIRTYKPKYNVSLKDDKHPLYIGITKDELPRIMAIRKVETKDFKYIYGPFPSLYNVKSILKMIRRVFPFADHKDGKKVCFYHHLGLCRPCPNEINNIQNQKLRITQKNLYKINLRNIKKLLDGKFTNLQKDMINQMNKLAEIQNFEAAAKIRNQLRTLDYIIEPRINPTEFIKNPNLEEDVRSEEIEKLKKIIEPEFEFKINTLERIECFDIAHLAGSSATASMVVFILGQKEPSEYRHFRIRQTKTRSDYDSLKEIAKRRSKNSWPTPDLIVVDGGLGQVKKFNEVFTSKNIPVIGIAKNPDRIIFPSGKKILAVRLLQRMRDEAHRFARRYHHKLISKSLLS